MSESLLALICGLSSALIAWAVLSGVNIKTGWQNGSSFLARWLDGRRRDKFNNQLPNALSIMANALRAGFSLSQAIDSVVEQGNIPISEEFSVLQQQIRVGMSFEEALTSMSDRVGSEDLTLVNTAIIVSRKTGGNVTEIFDKISDTIRGRMKIERKVKTLTAQGRLQGKIVSSLPFLLGAVMYVMKPQMMTSFLCSIVGVVCILAMILLVAIGWFFISRITKIEV